MRIYNIGIEKEVQQCQFLLTKLDSPNKNELN